MSLDKIKVTFCPVPLRDARVTRLIEADDKTIRDVLDACLLKPSASISVCVDGEPVGKSMLDKYYVKPGQHITARVVPQGGGGRGKKNPFATILTIALSVAAFKAAPFLAGKLGIASGIVKAGLGIVSRLIVSAIAPPPKQQLSQVSGQQNTSRTYSITGIRNSINKFGPVPVVLGQHKIYPPFGAPTFTERAGNNQFLRALFVVGYGELEINDIKIGNTPIDNFTEVEYIVRKGRDDDPPLSIFTDTVDEQSLTVDLAPKPPNGASGLSPSGAGTWATRTSEPDCKEISIDIVWPGGLSGSNPDGETGRRVTVQWQYRPVGSGDSGWITAPWIVAQGAGFDRVSRSSLVKVPLGQYDVRVRFFNAFNLINSKDPVLNIIQKTIWTVLRSVKDVEPIRFPHPLATIELRIRASEQLNGIVDQLNCIAGSVVDDWDKTSQTWVKRFSNNPASLYRYVLQGDANKNAQPDTLVDLPKLEYWHEYNELNNFSFNGVIDFRTTIDEQLKDVAAGGRASRTWIDNQIGVAIDEPQTVPVQRITPKNSWGFSSEKIFPEDVHALKIRFVNAEEDYQQDQRIVYDDGYNESNASKFEGMEMPNYTNPELVWRHGRFHLATSKLRPETYSLFMDPEHLIATRGDMVEVAHDVLLVGLSQGRVKQVIRNNNNDIVSIVCDEIFTFEEGKNYGVRVWFLDATRTIEAVNNTNDSTSKLNFSNPIVQSLVPNDQLWIDGIVMFGEAGLESFNAVVQSVKPTQDYNAQVFLQDASPEIHNADSGEIPEFKTNITQGPVLNNTINPPVILDLISDETVMLQLTGGNFQPRIIAYIAPPTGLNLDLLRLQARYRLSGSLLSDEEPGEWKYLIDILGSSDSIIFSDVADNKRYDLSFRYVSVGSPFPGLTSDWTEENNYLVVGKFSLPPDVLTFLRQDDKLIWSYPNPPIDLAGFEIRMNFGNSSNWDTAIKLHADVIKTSSFLFDTSGVYTRTYLIKAVDIAGLYSETAATLTINLGDPIFKNLVFETDHRSLGWTGDITNGFVDAGDLKANSDSNFWSEDPNELFWSEDPDDMFWDDTYLTLTYETEFQPEQDKIENASLLLEYDIDGDFYIEYKEVQSALFWSEDPDELFWSEDPNELFWSDKGDWVPWPGVLRPINNTYYFFRVVVLPGTQQGAIKQFKIKIDVDDITESLNDIVISAAGTRLPITKAYRSIKNIQITRQDDGGSSVETQIIDKDFSLGPLIRAFDNAGNPTSALIDATIQGY